MLRVAILGCGKIADEHAEQIARISSCKLVAVCDREELMAQQLQDRFKVPRRFSAAEDLLKISAPDVVHITTPPQTHSALGKLCLEAGCHVYIEKPFTVNVAEAEMLIKLAEYMGLKLTVGHNAQFSRASNRMRELIAQGYLGGPPVHLESYYCYDLGDAGYARALLGDNHHWVRQLPGGLLQNTISHGISKISEFFSDDLQVLAYGFTSPFLRSIGQADITDELRVIIHDGSMTAYFTFSSQMRPSLHSLRLFGPKNALIVDEQQQTVIKLRGKRYKSYLEQFIPPWNYAGQYVRNGTANMKRFIKSDLHISYGMKYLISLFYHSISYNTPVPIPYAEIMRTSRIMDEIVDQLTTKRKQVEADKHLERCKC
jgi:predicted dehydrogenase